MTLVILGAAALSREFYWHIKDSNTNYKNFIFVNDLPDAQTSLSLDDRAFPVIKDWTFTSSLPFIVAVGDPFIKQKLVEKALTTSLYPAPTIISNRAYIQDKKCQLGYGGLIAPGCILTTGITLGNYVTLNLNTTIGHDAILGNYTTTNPGVHISGNTSIGNLVEIGTGAIVRDYVTISDKNLIGAQCAVVKNITESNGIYAGVPCKKIKELT